MSDPALEVVPREVRLERRSRLLLIVCLLLFFVLVAYFAASSRSLARQAERFVAQRNRDTGRLLADQVMLIEHWEEMELNEEFLPIVKELVNRFSKQECTYGFIRPDGTVVRADGTIEESDEFERKVLARFTKAEPYSDTVEFSARRLPDRNEYRYYQPIRAEESCIAVCHGALPDGSVLGSGPALGGVTAAAPGDLMAIVKVTIPGARPRGP